VTKEDFVWANEFWGESFGPEDGDYRIGAHPDNLHPAIDFVRTGGLVATFYWRTKINIDFANGRDFVSVVFNDVDTKQIYTSNNGW
jgi:hypothetical protein